MSNSAFICSLKKGNEIRKFALWEDGTAREITNGLGKIYNDFDKLFKTLVHSEGYEEI